MIKFRKSVNIIENMTHLGINNSVEPAELGQNKTWNGIIAARILAASTTVIDV